MKAAPTIGAYHLCLHCGGFSLFLTRELLRVLNKREYDEIRNKVEIIKLENFRHAIYKKLTQFVERK